jgi:hypothetical protein
VIKTFYYSYGVLKKMYFVFRCDCGRVLYAKKGVDTRKCVCGKSLKVKNRRIFKKVETVNDASEAVRMMQEEIHGGIDFRKAVDISLASKQKRF